MNAKKQLHRYDFDSCVLIIIIFVLPPLLNETDLGLQVQILEVFGFNTREEFKTFFFYFFCTFFLF